jgi:tRNA-(ms[2]io[6]A)-hydroxylase
MLTLSSHPEVERLAAEEPPLRAVIRSVPLHSPTSGRWTTAAVADLDALLDDHAQCELKAASNALALVGRHPEHDELVRSMSALAREEMIHYRMVRDRLIARGGRPTRPRPNAYVRGLGSGRSGGEFALLDDLLIAALIEARSCERFVVLGRRIQSPDLAAFYARLARSESGHAHRFVALAGELFDPGLVGTELERLSHIESRILEELPVSARMHGGHRAI